MALHLGFVILSQDCFDPLGIPHVYSQCPKVHCVEKPSRAQGSKQHSLKLKPFIGNHEHRQLGAKIPRQDQGSGFRG